MADRVYVTIDLKSFYAAVECVDRGLDPLTTHLVVADESRTEKTICLAVSPSLRSYGISGRARLFEVEQQVKVINEERRAHAPGRTLRGSSSDSEVLKDDPALALDYIVAQPRMSCYMDRSAQIYQIYLKYLAPEDIVIYSVDEVFMDVTDYLTHYGLTARELTKTIIQDVYRTTQITATAGIGTNLYLSKVAVDIMAKHTDADEDGVRIAKLDEGSYRRQLWTHEPITDFWRVGKGYSRKLEKLGVFCMGDVARLSLSEYGENQLYREFGVNAELLIDHAWGWEPCTVSDIREYRPENNSLSSGQVLKRPYKFEEARLVVKEMANALSLELVEKGLAADQIVLTVGYDVENLIDSERSRSYHGEIVTDRYGRQIPKSAHGTANLGRQTASTDLITQAAVGLFDQTVNPDLTVRRMYIVAGHVVSESEIREEAVEPEQLDLFTDYEKLDRERAARDKKLEREKRRQETIVALQNKYGKNVVLKGMDLTEGATAIERNGQIGGHKA